MANPPPELLCPTCLAELKLVPGTGFDDYGWCEQCKVWKRGQS